MRERLTLRGAFGKAAGFFYAVVVSIVANLVFAYVLPHGSMPARSADASRQVAAIAPLPPTPPPAATPAPAPPVATASAASPPGTRPGPGSGGLY